MSFDPTNSPGHHDTEEVAGDSLFLSKRGLTTFPEPLLNKCQNIKHCYLESNSIAELPASFFQNLPNLKWLDLRNNDLVEIPTDGLDAGSQLEILLLQNNRIKNLPYQLALLPHLRGLQIAGNPIENVPIEILAGGLPTIIKFLRRIPCQQDSLLPVSETFITNTCQKECQSDYVNNGPIVPRVRSTKEMEDVGMVLSVKSLSTQAEQEEKKNKVLRPKKRKAVQAVRAYTQVNSACKEFKQRTAFRDKLVTPDSVKVKAEQAKKRARLRETLSRQSQMLQRLKDAESMKMWRMNPKRQEDQKLLDNYQVFPCRTFAETTPFDIDHDMMKMLSRKDIYQSLKQWEQKKKRQAEKRTQSSGGKMRDIESQMDELSKQLKLLDIEIREEQELTKKKSKLGSRIEQINQLRRVLQHLQVKNLLP